MLDVGTGCGMLGILASEKATSVVAVDLNPYAVGCAKENAKLNKAGGKMGFIQADLLTAFNESAKFDLILFNAPYLPVAEHEAGNLDWPLMGRRCKRTASYRPIYLQAPAHLKPDGRILLMQSTLANVEETISKFARA